MFIPLASDFIDYVSDVWAVLPNQGDNYNPVFLPSLTQDSIKAIFLCAGNYVVYIHNFLISKHPSFTQYAVILVSVYIFKFYLLSYALPNLYFSSDVIIMNLLTRNRFGN